MKRFRSIFLITLVLFSTLSYGMDVPQFRGNINFTPAEVKTFFIPQDQEQMRQELFAELDRAQRQVLVAVYWITDDAIVEKLIQIRRKGLDVQVIFDESSANAQQIMNKFLYSNITPLLYPSVGYGKMHNKFLVIDDAITITGSLNFTKTACDPECSVFNFENVLVLKSPEITRKYRENFFGIRKHILEYYVFMIAGGDQTPWFKPLINVLSKQNLEFQTVAQSVLQEIRERVERERVENFFGFAAPKRARFEPPTQNQINFLEARGIASEGMTKQDASNRIGEIKEQEKQFGLAAPKRARIEPPTQKQFESPSQKQIDFLARKGISAKGMSKQQASNLIGRIIEQE
jgi:phosphatidylserine/phosphatidylglycerophosphate/cardiolipin synthase-like enzyme